MQVIAIQEAHIDTYHFSRPTIAAERLHPVFIQLHGSRAGVGASGDGRPGADCGRT